MEKQSIFWILLALVAAAPATAMTPTSQDRLVRAYAELIVFSPPPLITDLEEETAPDFSPFNETVSAVVESWSSGSATQHSEIVADRISMTGSLMADADTFQIGVVSRADSETHAFVSFDLTESQRYRLWADFDIVRDTCGAFAFGYVRLTGPSGIVEEALYVPDYLNCDVGVLDCVETLKLRSSGELAPGTYALDFEITANAYDTIHPEDMCFGPDITVSYDVELLIPPPLHLPVLSPGMLGVMVSTLLGAGVHALRSRRRNS